MWSVRTDCFWENSCLKNPQRTLKSWLMRRGWIRNKFHCLFQGDISCRLMEPVGDRLKPRGRQLLLPQCAAQLGKPVLQKQRMQQLYLGSKIKQMHGEKTPWKAVKYKNITSQSCRSLEDWKLHPGNTYICYSCTMSSMSGTGCCQIKDSGLHEPEI